MASRSAAPSLSAPLSSARRQRTSATWWPSRWPACTPGAAATGGGSMPETAYSLPLRILPPAMLRTGRFGLGGRGSAHLIERHARVYRHTWGVLISGFFEPIFYLLSIGVGLGKLVGTVTGPGGHLIDFPSFVAPALLASSSMN